MNNKIRDYEKDLAESDKTHSELRDDVRNTLNEGFNLHLNWIDKVINLSVSIIGASITVFIALKGEIVEYVENPQIFFYMWLSFVVAGGSCILARIGYSRAKINHTNYVVGQMNKQNLCSWEIITEQEYVEMGKPIVSHHLQVLEGIQKMKVEEEGSSEIKKIRAKKWSEYSEYASFIGIVCFFLGVIIFVRIGFDLVSDNKKEIPHSYETPLNKQASGKS